MRMRRLMLGKPQKMRADSIGLTVQQVLKYKKDDHPHGSGPLAADRQFASSTRHSFLRAPREIFRRTQLE